MKNLKKFFSILIVLFVLLGTQIYAATAVVRLPSNQVKKFAGTDTRSGKYSYTLAELYSVYPTTGGEDNFRYCQTALYDSTGSTQISNWTVLDEQDGDTTNVYIKEGYLDTSTVKFAFRGNSAKYGAYAYVFYSGM